MAKAPKPGMSTEELQELQAERAKEFGIEALAAPPARLNIPRGWPRKFSDYGDPTNIALPLVPESKLKSARARFKKVADRYKAEKSKRVVHTRIVQRMLREGLKVSFNPKDKLDMLLSPAIRRRLTKKSFDGALVFELRALTDLDLKKYEPAEGELVVVSYAAAGNVDLTQFGRGPGDRIDRQALQDIGDWLVSRYKTVLFNHLDNEPIGRVLEAEVVTDDADGEVKLRVVHTISGTEPKIIGKVKDGTLSKLSIRFIPLEVKLETDPKTKKQVRVILRAVGLECSIVSIPMNWAAEVLEWEARSFTGEQAETQRRAIEIAGNVEWKSASDFEARISLADLSDELRDALEKRMKAAPVSREDAEIGAGITSCTREGDELVLCGSLGAAGDTAPELRSLVLYGQAATAADGTFASVGIEAAELSAAPVADSVKSYHYEEPTMAAESADFGACARIGELLKSIATETDAERVEEFRSEVDSAFAEVDAGEGAPMPHPLSKGAAVEAFVERFANAKSAADCHIAALCYAVDTVDCLSAKEYSGIDPAMKAALVPLVEGLRAALAGTSKAAEPAPPAEAPAPAEKGMTAEEVNACVKSAAEVLEASLKSAHEVETVALRAEIEAKTAAIEALKTDAKAAFDVAEKAAQDREAALKTAHDALAARVERIENHVGKPNSGKDAPSHKSSNPPSAPSAKGPEADIDGDLVSHVRKRHKNVVA